MRIWVVVVAVVASLLAVGCSAVTASYNSENQVALPTPVQRGDGAGLAAAEGPSRTTPTASARASASESGGPAQASVGGVVAGKAVSPTPPQSQASSSSAASGLATPKPALIQSSAQAPTPEKDSEGRYYLGNPRASIVVEQWIDVYSPDCTLAVKAASRVVSERGADVKLVFRHFPRSEHQIEAAEAVEAAGEQGKFWAMLEGVLTHQPELGPVYYERQAIYLGLNPDTLKAAVRSHRYSSRVLSDRKQALEQGLGSAPTFRVNRGDPLYAPTYWRLVKAIQDAEKLAARQSSTATVPRRG